MLKPHDCFIRATPSDLTKLKVIFFDFECRQDEIRQCEQGYVPNNADRCNTCKYKITKCLSCLRCKNCLVETCGRNVHIPNLVIAHSACAMCEYDSIDDETKCSFCGSQCDHCVSSSGGEYAREPCLDCGYRKVVFKGDATLAKFGEWLFNRSHKNFTVMSHGGKIYDNIFILNYLLDSGKTPTVTYNGTKIMYLYEPSLSITILDSLNFFPMKPARLPATFNITGLKKGYFCHSFNTKSNENYVGPYPIPDLFGVANMTPEDRNDFFCWYDNLPDGALFDLQKEIVEYCNDDVNILREAALRFRRIVMNITGRQTVMSL